MKPASSRSSAEAQQESQTIETRRNDNQKAHTPQGRPTWSSADRGAAAGWAGVAQMPGLWVLEGSMLNG